MKLYPSIVLILKSEKFTKLARYFVPRVCRFLNIHNKKLIMALGLLVPTLTEQTLAGGVPYPTYVVICTYFCLILGYWLVLRKISSYFSNLV